MNKKRILMYGLLLFLGIIPILFYSVIFYYYINIYLLQYQLFGYSSSYSLNYNRLDFFDFPLGFFIQGLFQIFINTNQFSFIQYSYIKCFIFYISGYVQFLFFFIFSYLNIKKYPVFFYIASFLSLLFILFLPTEDEFKIYKENLVYKISISELSDEEKHELKLHLLEGKNVFNEENIKANYIISDSTQNSIERQEKNNLLVLLYQNSLNIDDTKAVSNIYFKMLTPNKAYYLYENKFNSMSYTLNLNSDEIIYRGYYFYKKINHKIYYSQKDTEQIVCDSNYIFKDKICFWYKKNNSLLLKNYYSQINKSNINLIANYALMGDDDLSYHIQEYYKHNGDYINYLKWLVISAENNNKNSQAELGNLLLSPNVSQKELNFLNLAYDEKNIRGKFWLNMAIKKPIK